MYDEDWAAEVRWYFNEGPGRGRQGTVPTPNNLMLPRELRLAGFLQDLAAGRAVAEQATANALQNIGQFSLRQVESSRWMLIDPAAPAGAQGQQYANTASFPAPTPEAGPSFDPRFARILPGQYSYPGQTNFAQQNRQWIDAAPDPSFDLQPSQNENIAVSTALTSQNANFNVPVIETPFSVGLHSDEPSTLRGVSTRVSGTLLDQPPAALTLPASIYQVLQNAPTEGIPRDGGVPIHVLPPTHRGPTFQPLGVSTAHHLPDATRQVGAGGRPSGQQYGQPHGGQNGQAYGQPHRRR